MPYWLKKLAKGLVVTSAVGVILLAIAVGALRLALTQLPSYQQELQSWIAGELGLSFEFEAVTARLGFGGPELTFQEASVAGAAAEESFLSARRASITLDLWSLLIERELTASALTFLDTRLTLLRTAEGLRIQGVPSRSAPTVALAEAIPREVRVAVRDSRIVYDDAVTAESWLFTDVAASFVRTEQRLEFELTAQPPEGLAEQIQVSIGGVLDDAAALPVAGRMVADLQGVDLVAARRLIPALQRGEVAGRGDLSLQLDWTEQGPRSATADLAFEDVAFAADQPNVFDVIDLHADWSTTEAGESLLTLSDVRLSHNGLGWPDGGRTRLSWSIADAAQSLSLSSDFLRLEDLDALVSLLSPDTALAAYWAELNPRGDLSTVELSLDRSPQDWDYSISGRFDGLALQAYEAWPGIAGLSGDVRAEPRSGRIAFQSRDLTIHWPDLLAEPVEASLLDGILVWRLGRDVLRVVSDGLRLGVLDALVDSDLELTLPLDGSSPRLDLESSVTSFDALAAKRLLPASKLPVKVSDWVEQAVQGGRIEGMQLSFFGALDAFPFDERDGQFRAVVDISDGALAYIRDWPAAVDLDGTIEFINSGFTASGSGRVLGNVSRNIRVGIPDFRAPVLGIQADTSGLLTDFLAFVQGSPLIAGHLGPGYDGVQAVGGRADVTFDLSLPLTDFEAYGLNGRLQIVDGALKFEGFPLVASEINGNLDIDGTRVTARDIDAVLLDGPVKAQVVASEQPGYRAGLIVAGETTADAVLGSFALPYAARLAGQTRWQGRLQIPTTSDAPQPVRIAVSSNLTGMALKFPAPFAKPPAEPMNLQLEFAFRLREGLRVQGNLGATRRFVLDYDSEVGGYQLRRGAVRFGGEEPELAAASGVTVTGSLPELDVSEWLGVPAEADFDEARMPVVDADLELTEFFVFGQQLGSSRFSAHRGETAWEIDVDSEAIAGRINVPIQLQNRPQIVAEMERLYLSSGRAGSLGRIDPRRLPGITLRSSEFGIGARRLGSMSAEVVPDALGLRLVSFESSNEFLEAEGSGSWLAGADGDVTRVAFNLGSSDVAGALRTLGFDAAMEGELGDVTASVYWPGPPAADWLDHVSGDVALRVETGSMLDLDPGAGRMVGLMSIVALPRRLALDFRDVFNKGLVFDEIAGDFILVDGNAFTDNLKLTGPGAEIGIVGRTGLRDRDYEQQAVVTAEPGNILPTVGGLLGGAGVGAALLIFTRIFKRPLRGIGQASYCITGTWENPAVERLTGDRLRSDELCAALPPLAAGQVAN